MIVYPSIDIRDGRVVRLAQGDYDRQTTYADDPVAVADRFFAAGATWIHVVDLDAARSGELTNTDAIAAICTAAAACDAHVQNGGGVRDRQRIDLLFAKGVERVVIGSAAVKDWAWFEDLLDDPAYPNERLALGLDARDGKVAAEGWTEQLETPATAYAEKVAGTGLGAIVYTDIARDGMLSGVNLEATRGIVETTDVPVIASGGVSCVDDLRACASIGCAGAILGRAFYEGKVNLHEALSV